MKFNNDISIRIGINCCWIISLLFFADSPIGRAEDEWGHIRGKIVVTGELPKIPREKINKDRATCLNNENPPLDDNLIVSTNGELRDAFVMMYLGRRDTPKIHPSYSDTEETVVLDNKNCRFEPHAVFVRTGQTLRLANSDDVGHNCHAKLFRNEFNVNVPIGDYVDVKLKDSEKVPGPVVCDIHPWMDAVVLVRDEPYVAITDENGKFEIMNIPAGKWKFQFWHKKTGYMRKLNVAGKDVGRRGDVELEIEGGKTVELGTLEISGSEFIK